MCIPHHPQCVIGYAGVVLHVVQCAGQQVDQACYMQPFGAERLLVLLQRRALFFDDALVSFDGCQHVRASVFVCVVILDHLVPPDQPLHDCLLLSAADLLIASTRSMYGNPGSA